MFVKVIEYIKHQAVRYILAYKVKGIKYYQYQHWFCFTYLSPVTVELGGSNLLLFFFSSLENIYGEKLQICV